MPRLGSGAAAGGGGGEMGENKLHTRRPLQFMSYVRKFPKPNLRNILLAMVGFFILRNLLKNDYRKEEMNYLRNPAMTSKDIEKALSMSEEERLKFINARGNDVEKLKHDIHYLLNEVQTLRAKGRDSKNFITGRDSDLKAMDHLHMEKRKAREEQLLKDHPDFVPSRRVPRVDKQEDGETATT